MGPRHEPRLHLRRVAPASLWHHAREEPGHGDGREEEVRHEAAPGHEGRDKEDRFRQLYRDGQNVSKFCIFTGFLMIFLRNFIVSW